MDRRAFLEAMTVAAASGLALSSRSALAADGSELYDIPRFGNVSLLHFTDCHAQLLPQHYREPNVNIGVGPAYGKAPHIVGEKLLGSYGLAPRTREAHAFTYLDFPEAAKLYGKMGGFAHLATLVKRLKATRPGALLLDGGDNWQGSGTSLWTRAQDMVDASKLLGVDVMTGHWEFTYGQARVKEVVEKDFKGKVQFLAQNVATTDFGDPVFEPFTLREVNGATIAIVGQAFPYTPIANPRYFVPEWTFGIQEAELQKRVAEARAKGAQAVVLLSHNGMDVDLKLASRVTGIDVILGGHTHDAMPRAIPVQNPAGTTLVTNAGCNGKFLGLLDMEVRGGKVQEARYRLLPVFSNLLPPDEAMAAYITKARAPYKAKLEEKLATTDGLLYRRGNFSGTVDQLILDAIMAVRGAEIAFSPGFRWGTTLLPGQAITTEQVMDWSAITYPQVTLNTFDGHQVKAILEDVCDNIFNPDPYYQQGGDMVRVGGLTYTCTPGEKMGNRISDMRLAGKPIDPHGSYKVAGWAPVAEGAKGDEIWDVITQYLRAKKTIAPPTLNLPKLVGVEGNPGIA